MRNWTKVACVVGSVVFGAGCGTDSVSIPDPIRDAGGPSDSADAGNLSDATVGDADGGVRPACRDQEKQNCYSGPSGTAGVGACVAGVRTCQGGSFGSCAGEVTPSAETCDGVDNDCDGTADNGNPGSGQACPTGLLGVCGVGATACVSGETTCNVTVTASPETCDGLDNDCNGTADDDVPGVGVACVTGLPGVCTAGKVACTEGATTCTPNTAASAEVCDGLDNDCDGTVDDGACAPGVALRFDGVDDRVEMPVPPLFNDLGANDFTMEAWVYPTSTAFTRIVFAQASSSSFASLSRNSGGELYFYVVEGGATVSGATASNTVPLDQWTHVAGTYTTATNTIAVYVNGALQSVIPGGSSSTGANGVMAIGSRSGGAQNFQGMIDEVRIWSVARSACELASRFACEVAPVEAGLVASYHFDQGTPGADNPGMTELTDSAPAGNDGTLSGFSLTGTTSNWVSPGGGVGGGVSGLVCGPSGC